MPNLVHIIAGPTASGKSASAIALAQQKNGVILNADATQCYADLHILSARPDADELAQAEHRLYGIWSGNQLASVGDWLSIIVPEIKSCWQNHQLPIVCGGTGFYLKALMEGLSPIPNIAPAIRAKLASHDNSALYDALLHVDKKAAISIGPNNRQRLMRALEVCQGTEKTMSAWQALPKEPPLNEANFKVHVIDIPRETLYARCDARFDAMWNKGAVAEVEALLTKGYAPDLPVMKAVGVPEIAAYLRGEMDKEAASALAKQHTRHYAKRQLTWLRNQF